MTDLSALAHDIFSAQGFSQLLGAELIAVGADSAEIRIRNRAELQQQHGYLHGGVISYLADNALTFAGGLALGGDALTAGYTINYTRPASGDTIVARAKAMATTQRQAICQCSIYVLDHDAEHLVAVAQGAIIAAGRDAAGA